MATETKPPSHVELRQRRERLGLTRQELAAAAECSLSMIGLLKYGYDPPRSAVRERVEHVLDELEAERASFP